MKSIRRAKAVELARLSEVILLVIARLGLQALLYHAGFQAFTADDFGRTVVAAIWAQKPFAQWCAVWLPFPMYMYGVALRFIWELVWVPRAIGIVFGIAAILLMYQLSEALFDEHRIGLVGAILLAINPVHIWLSSTPLTETVHIALVLAFLLCLVLYSKSKNHVFLYLGAFSLAIANGFRFDAWIVSGLFSLYIVGEGTVRVLRQDRYTRQAPLLPVAAIIPWVFPIVWLTGCCIETGNPLFSPAWTLSYNKTWYGSARDFSAYLDTFLGIDPCLPILAPLSLVTCLIRYRSSRSVKWYVVMAVIPLAIFVCLMGGQIEPPANNTRYFALYAFILYPSVAYLLSSAVGRITRSQLVEIVLLTIVVLVIVVTQVHATFQFVNDPAADGLEVGKRIRALRAEHPELSQRPVLVELSYWQYLAVHVGANDISLLIYDRELDLEHRQTVSLFLSDLGAIRNCLALYNVSYIAVKSPEIKEVIERELGMLSSEEVNHFSFYRVPDMMRDDVGDGLCPLAMTPSLQSGD